MQHHPRRVRTIAAALAAVAGFTDAVGFLSLGGFFVSFMSGNSTRLGNALAFGAADAVVAGVLVAAFVAGVALGTHLHDRRWHARVAVVIALLLVLAGVAHATSRVASMALAAMAMGALNTWAVASSPLPVGLTYMTGTLVKLGQLLARARQGTWKDAFAYLLHWLALVAGAVLGTWAYAAWAEHAMFVAAAGVLAVAAATLRRDAAQRQ